jgi:phosphatidate cytidylyltransferase
MTLAIALNYGARNELVQATRRLADQVAAGTLGAADIDEQKIEAALDTHDLPPLDLLIRTSGEQRLSNFLLWQAAYASCCSSTRSGPISTATRCGRPWPNMRGASGATAVCERRRGPDKAVGPADPLRGRCRNDRRGPGRHLARGVAVSALIAAAAALMLVEWADLHRVPRLWAWVGGGLLALLLTAGAEYLYPAAEAPLIVDAVTWAPNWLGFGGVALLGLVLGLASRRAAMVGGMLYVGLPAFALISLGWVWELLVFWVFIVTWATDILAYFAGRSIGGPKLAPRISPNKTWAGLAGGVAGAALLGWLTARNFEMEPIFHWLGGPMALIAQAGDLYESWVKRRAGVKDSGTLLPGHGGVLDRLDGLLAVALATTLVLMAGLWTA